MKVEVDSFLLDLDDVEWTGVVDLLGEALATFLLELLVLWLEVDVFRVVEAPWFKVELLWAVEVDGCFCDATCFLFSDSLGLAFGLC